MVNILEQNKNMKYAELSIKSNFTFLKGGSHPEEYARRAVELGLKSFAITDENSVSGIVRAHRELKNILTHKPKSEISLSTRLIPGMEINTTEGIIITSLAKTRQGWADICRLLTQGNLKTKKGSCLITVENVLQYGSETELILHMPKKSLVLGVKSEWMELAKKITEFFKNTSLFLSPNYDGADTDYFSQTANVAKELNIRLVASACPIMHHGSRRRIVDLLSAVRKKCEVENLGYEAEINAERRMRGPQELKKIFAKYTNALINSDKIAENCCFSLDELHHEYPSEIHEGEHPNKKLSRLTYEGLNWRYPKGVRKEVKEKIKHELSLIKKLNYSPYFLTVHDIVKFARSKSILCQGRGSAANSIVCFCLGITSVSPEVGTMVFERFVSEARNEPPDIDIDFEHERREEVIQYIYNKFGRHRTGLCATVVHYRSKRAIRDVGKAMGLSREIIEILLSQFSSWKNSGSKKNKLLEVGLSLSNRRLNQTIALIETIIGFPRHLSQHVGGFILTENRLDELVPIENAAMPDRTVISWDKHDIDALGILKVDILGLGMLTCIQKAFSLIRTYHGKEYDLSTLPAEDPKVYDMLCRADTIGVFQVESRAQMNFLPRMQPRNFYDLIIQIAIVRPGPIQGNMVHPYLRRRNRTENIDFPSGTLREVLRRTLGIPLFQEQAMQIAIIGAGFSAEEADMLRRSLATFKKNGNISKFRDRFIKGMISNGFEKSFSEKCFSQIEGFGKYGFPESHAASFALIVYASAWIKYQYPEIFACALLNSQPMGFYSTRQIITDAKKHGVEVRHICVNNSLWDNTIEMGEKNKYALRIGFRQIKGFSNKDANKIISARGNGYYKVCDIFFRSEIKYKSLLKIIKSDCLNALGLTRNEAFWEAQKLRPIKEMSLVRGTFDNIFSHEDTFVLPKDTTGRELVKDYKILNYSFRSHPVKLLRSYLEKLP
ncbi:MAG: error-prone DNA polymerase [Pseudomonadota bacterium]|nr:error-prone DNA polymerase [Pseudomonadota bacterium]